MWRGSGVREANHKAVAVKTHTDPELPGRQALVQVLHTSELSSSVASKGSVPSERQTGR